MNLTHSAASLTAIVVEDSPTQALSIRQRVQRCGFSVRLAKHGQEALSLVAAERPTLVLTDLDMPVMNGLELIRELNQLYPGLPVLLLTAQGSEEVAVQALKAGAAGYVPKPKLEHDLPRVLESILAITRASKQHLPIGQALTQTGSHYSLPNDVALIPPLVSRLQKNLERLQLFSQSEWMRIGMALRESLVNAIEHGNLELSSELRETDDTAYRKAAEERRHQDPYRQRHVRVTARQSKQGVTYTIGDEGRGFDPRRCPTRATRRISARRAAAACCLFRRSWMKCGTMTRGMRSRSSSMQRALDAGFRGTRRRTLIGGKTIDNGAIDN